MKKEFFTPSTLYPTFGYSHVVTVEGGKLVVLSGLVPFDKECEIIGEGDFAAQAKQVFENIGRALGAAGATYNDVIKLNYYVVDFKTECREILAKIRDQYIPTVNPPASVLLGVSALAVPGMLIEIEATAFIE